MIIIKYILVRLFNEFTVDRVPRLKESNCFRYYRITAVWFERYDSDSES